VVRHSMLLLAMGIGVATGCRHHCHTRCDSADHKCLGERLRDRIEDRQEGRRRDPGTSSDPVVPPGVIPPRGETIPPVPLPVTPSRSNTIDWDPTASLAPPRRSSEKIPVTLPPLAIPSDPVLSAPPSPSNRTLLLPDPLLLEPLRTSPNPTSGVFGEPIPPVPVREPDQRRVESPSGISQVKSDLPAESATLPAGVESFAPVPGLASVASGRKPSLEGLDALKAKGFKTVLYVHAPDADLSAAKETVEKRGLKFVPLAVSPQTLGTASRAFAERIQNADSKPLYAYDLDGTRLGSLWYLHFRTVEMLGDEGARIRAGALGLRDATASEEQKQYWIAIQDQLAKR